MTLKPARLLLALLAVAAMPAFAQNLAVVNGKAIPSSRADAVVKQVVAQGQQADSPQLRDAVKKDLIAREVMMQEAVKQGFEKDATVKSQMDTARQTIIINALVREYAGRQLGGRKAAHYGRVRGFVNLQELCGRTERRCKTITAIS